MHSNTSASTENSESEAADSGNEEGQEFMDFGWNLDLWIGNYEVIAMISSSFAHYLHKLTTKI